MGLGTSGTDVLVPTRVNYATGWVEFFEAGNHTLARKSDGSYWSWGDNEYGQLGSWDNENRNTPHKISFEPPNTPPTYTQISNKTITVGERIDLMLYQYFTDPESEEGEGLTFTASSSDSNIVTAGITGLVLVGIAKSAGTATVTVTASDGVHETTQSFTVTVINNPPSYTQIPTQYTKKNRFVTVNLNNYFTSTDGLDFNIFSLNI